jgi:hypothetical protein
MRNRAEEFRLDLTLCFGESLFDDDVMSKIERVLRSEAEKWAQEPG